MKDLTDLQFIIVEWILAGICIFFFIARIAVRTWKGMWTFWISEVWLGLAVACFTTLVIGTHYYWVTGPYAFGSIDNLEYNQWSWAVILISEIEFYFPRFSLLAFYNELFPISEEKLRKCMYAVMALNAICFVAVLFINLFWCGLPISTSWLHPETCSLFLTMRIYKITWPMNITCEILVFILPFGMLHRLKATPRSEKIALICLFSIGIISVVVSICRFVFGVMSVFTFNTTVVASAETVSQIVVCAIPALRPVLPPMANFCSRVFNLVTNSTQRSDDERALHGSFSSMGAREKNGSRDTDGNMPELGEWNSHGTTTEISANHNT